MNGIQIRNNRILYYKNTAGYIEKGKAVVDPMFETDELKSYLLNTMGLDVEWTPGTFSRMAEGKLDPEGNLQVLKKCRVYQLKPDTDIMMKFIKYDELLEQFGEPNPDNYRVVYDGEVETNDLEELCDKFDLNHSPGYEGHNLSISDVIELYDGSSSTFHYIDRTEFKPLSSFHQAAPSMKKTEPAVSEDDPVVDFFHRIDAEYAEYLERLKGLPTATLILHIPEAYEMQEVYHALRNNPYLPCGPAETLNEFAYPLQAMREYWHTNRPQLAKAIAKAYSQLEYDQAFCQKQKKTDESAISSEESIGLSGMTMPL